MSTLRQDITTNEWVIVAPQRARRPHGPRAAERPALPPFDPTCPFCPGNEDQTPPEITRTSLDGGWDQRVFPNLYPALAAGLSTERTGETGFREMEGLGSHEVVVESPLHNERMGDMEPDRLARVLRIWRARYLALKEHPWTKSVLVFRNFGERAGTSLPHPHSQIVAMPVFSPDALHRFAVATRYFDDTGRCVYDALRDAELRAGERVIAERERFVALVPFAARGPFETWLMPREHQTSFGMLEDADADDLAHLLRDVLRALRRAAGDPDYNLVVHSAPAHEETKPFFLWHIRVLPRMTTEAGFELGTGMAINTSSPEECAEELRRALSRVGAA